VAADPERCDRFDCGSLKATLSPSGRLVPECEAPSPARLDTRIVKIRLSRRLVLARALAHCGGFLIMGSWFDFHHGLNLLRAFWLAR